MLSPELKGVFQRHPLVVYLSYIYDFLVGIYTDKDLFIDNIDTFYQDLLKEGLNPHEIELLKKLAEIDIDHLIAQFHQIHNFHVFDPPLHDPAEFLSFLKWLHSDTGFEQWKLLQLNPNNFRVYDYENIKPSMIQDALLWAHGNRFDPRELSPDLILRSQGYADSRQKFVKDYEVFIQNRKSKLRQNPELMHILFSNWNVWLHATPSIWEANRIMENGLLFSFKSGLPSTALALLRGNNTSVVVEKNLDLLAKSHQNYRFQVIIIFPKLSREQLKQFYQLHRADTGSFFGKKLEQKVTAISSVGQAIRVFDAIIEPRYIFGHVDLEEGTLVKNSKFAS